AVFPGASNVPPLPCATVPRCGSAEGLDVQDVVAHMTASEDPAITSRRAPGSDERVTDEGDRRGEGGQRRNDTAAATSITRRRRGRNRWWPQFIRQRIKRRTTQRPRRHQHPAAAASNRAAYGLLGAHRQDSVVRLCTHPTAGVGSTGHARTGPQGYRSMRSPAAL